MASIGSPTDEPPLHPEIYDIVSLVAAHTQKVYFSGPARHTSMRTRSWEELRDVWAQLSGTTLSIKEVRTDSQKGKEATPTYVNITDSVRPPFHLRYLRDSTKQSPPDRYNQRVLFEDQFLNGRPGWNLPARPIFPLSQGFPFMDCCLPALALGEIAPRRDLYGPPRPDCR